MERAQGTPLLVDTQGSYRRLERIYLGAGLHNEDWLQDLIQQRPEVLPVAQIEPSFGELVPVAREVACGHGFIDNLFVTPSGDLLLVETKLWRNNEIRREVVAQALDYVAALTKMTFSEFEKVLAKAQGGPPRLYDLLADHPDALSEPAFIDAVAHNLERGRMLVIALGDGIRSETELLAELLQSHAGAHFTFALVELATWRDHDGTILTVPNTLAKTVMIERGVVRLTDSAISVDPTPIETMGRAQSLSMTDFMGLMAERDPSLPSSINSFIDAITPLGIYPELRASLNFKLDAPGLPRPANFGFIDKNGKFWTNPASWNLPDSIWRPYFAKVAQLINGTVIDEPNNRFVAISGRSAPRITDLLPEHHEGLVAAIETAIRSLHDMAE